MSGQEFWLPVCDRHAIILSRSANPLTFTQDNSGQSMPKHWRDVKLGCANKRCAAEATNWLVLSLDIAEPEQMAL